MPCLRSLRLYLILLVSGSTHVFAACPAKISFKLCPIFEAAADTAYLQVRIVLDPKVESSFVWDKSQSPKARPLRIYSDSLIAKYDLRRIGNPDSAYAPLYAPQDFWPAIDDVLYHNASVTKANVGRLINETYVATVEPGCVYRISGPLCTEINTQPDSVRIFTSIRLNGSLQTDSVARKAYLSKYDVRDTNLTTGRCFGSGYMVTPVSIRALAMDPQVDYLASASIACILSVTPGSKPAPFVGADFRSDHSGITGLTAGRCRIQLQIAID